MNLSDQMIPKFKAAYPLLMSQRGETSYRRFGLEIGIGWYPLVFELFGLFDDLQRATGAAVGISQIKEKFGSLRVYCRLPVESLEQDIIESVFEYLSARTCDFCGAPGKIGEHKGLWAARCDSHRAIKQEQQAGKIRLLAIERFLSYERQGVSTEGFAYADAKRSGKGQGYASLRVYELSERLISLLEESLIDQLSVSEYLDRPTDELSNVIGRLKERGKKIALVGDGSIESDRALGRAI